MYYYDKKKNYDRAPSNANDCKMLVNLIKNNIFTYREIIQISEETYYEGYICNDPRDSVISLRTFLYWITLQESFNYPGGEGLLMPFKRYAEAIDTTLDGTQTNLKDVIYDAQNARYGIRRCNLLSPPRYYPN